MKNKYENIDIIDLDDKVEDIIEIFIDNLYHTDKTVGVVANKEIAEYILDNILDLNETSVKEVNLVDRMNIDEYILSVDDDGYVTCIPIESLHILDNVDVVYIDMDGDIEQGIIDYCVNEDNKVILFGQKYDECDCDHDCENCDCTDIDDKSYVHVSEDNDGNQHGFTASKSDGDSYVSYSYYTTEDLSEDDIRKMLKAFGF